ncbi:MAG TPA: ABC transporter ATP-binding protein [Bacillota bacterium]|nr:ABC transporter ATP-binding protein [Bacillota bacterium]
MKVLEIQDLHTYFATRRGLVKAVNGVSLSVEEGKTLGVVGESGSGKSQTAMSILQLFENNQKIYDGKIIFQGRDITNISTEELYKIRGNAISMIFQEPMTSLNPVFTVSRQISEPLILHQKMTKRQAHQKSIEMLAAVKIPNPENMVMQYPHQLSGGMRQRVMIAMALACRPSLLIADEPTTALDVTIQAQILRLMNDLRTEFKTSIMFITHDLGVINQMADDVAVMYSGQVVEMAPVDYIFKQRSDMSHPYTEALLESIPGIGATKGRRLEVIPGTVPHPLDLPPGCKFAPRCKFATEKCQTTEPDLFQVTPVQSVRCFYPERGVRSSGE